MIKKNKINKISYINSSNIKTGSFILSKKFRFNVLRTKTMPFCTDSKQNTQHSKKKSLPTTKIYIYLLYEYFILDTNYVSQSFFLIYLLVIGFVNQDYIIQANLIDSVIFILIAFFIWQTIISSVLFPYIIFIPGDNSKMENILTNSELPHAKLLFKLKLSNKF